MSLAPTRTSVVFPNPPAPYSPVVILTVPTRRPASAPATVALQFGRDDRGKPLAVLGEIDDLTACRVMRRVGDLARCLFKRNLAHVTTVRQRSSPSGKLPGPGCGLGLVAGPGEDGAAGAEGDRGANREVGAADDADHEGAVVGGTVGLDVQDGVVAVVAVGRDPAG